MRGAVVCSRMAAPTRPRRPATSIAGSARARGGLWEYLRGAADPRRVNPVQPATAGRVESGAGVLVGCLMNHLDTSLVVAYRPPAGSYSAVGA